MLKELNIQPERRRNLAAQVGASEQYLYQCLTGRRDMNPAEALRIEKATEGELSRQMLCQKTWFGIWPELEEKQPVAPASRAQPAIKAEAEVAHG